MEPRLDRPDRDAERRRDVGQRHPEVVVQDDDRPSAGVETAQGRVDELAVGERAGHVDDVGHVDRVELDLDDAPASMAGDVETGIHGEAMEPGVEPIGVTQTPEVAPGSDQCLLDRVAGQLRVPEDEAGRRSSRVTAPRASSVKAS